VDFSSDDKILAEARSGESRRADAAPAPRERELAYAHAGGRERSASAYDRDSWRGSGSSYDIGGKDYGSGRGGSSYETRRSAPARDERRSGGAESSRSKVKTVYPKPDEAKYSKFDDSKNSGARFDYL
jgi:hypothetical protein